MKHLLYFYLKKQKVHFFFKKHKNQSIAQKINVKALLLLFIRYQKINHQYNRSNVS